MLILTESLSSQSFTVIPRSYTATSTVIKEEGADVSATYSSTFTRVDYNDTLDTEGTYLKIAGIIALEEYKFYSIEVLNGTDVIYKDRIYCTNQTIADFSINNGEYVVAPTTDNTFIVI